MRSERRLERVREAHRDRSGGLVVMDDHRWPSVGTAARYFELNMGWRVVAGAFDGERLRALRLPDPPFEPAFEDFQPFL
jgi:hypothetical protein